MFTPTFTMLVFLCVTVYMKSVEPRKGRHCLDNCQCPNGTACLPTCNGKGRKRCQECGCRLMSQCIKPSTEVLCNCSDSGYTGVYCETEIQTECPEGWFNNRSSCYYFVNTIANWTSAKAGCEALDSNAYLVEITDNEENTVVYTIAGYSDPWIGLTDSAIEGMLIWATSGDSVGYFPGSTLYYSTSDARDCVFMHGTHWDVGYCYNARTYVCERPLVI